MSSGPLRVGYGYKLKPRDSFKELEEGKEICIVSNMQILQFAIDRLFRKWSESTIYGKEPSTIGIQLSPETRVYLLGLSSPFIRHRRLLEFDEYSGIPYGEIILYGEHRCRFCLGIQRVSTSYNILFDTGLPKSCSSSNCLQQIVKNFDFQEYEELTKKN